MLDENVILCVSGEVANEPVEYLSRRFSVGSAKKKTDGASPYPAVIFPLTKT